MNTDVKKYLEELAAGNDATFISAESGELEEEREGQLTIDVYQTPTSIVVESPIAGVDSDDIDINITSESVTIRGKREKAHTIKEDDYFYQECYWGKFSRSIILPEEVDADGSEATIKNGVLKIVMPKLSRHKGKKVKVKGE